MPGVGSGPISITLTPAATKPASSAASNMYPDSRVSLPMSTVPPCGASTRAAALASRNAKSTVIGYSPTRPRMPSVPKYLRAIECFSLGHRRGNADGVDRGGHVVGAHDTRSMENRNGGESHAPRRSVDHFTSRESRQHRLAREPDGNRYAEVGQPRERLEQDEVVDDALAESEARIDREPRSIDARPAACADALGEEAAHVGDDVRVARSILHRARLALHVHETQAGARRRGHGERARLAQPAYVVDDVGRSEERRVGKEWKSRL